jgi:hypothetical protein
MLLKTISETVYSHCDFSQVLAVIAGSFDIGTVPYMAVYQQAINLQHFSRDGGRPQMFKR